VVATQIPCAPARGLSGARSAIRSAGWVARGCSEVFRVQDALTWGFVCAHFLRGPADEDAVPGDWPRGDGVVDRQAAWGPCPGPSSNAKAGGFWRLC